jgi:hypothetical protein
MPTEAQRAVEPVLEEQVLDEILPSDLLDADETSWKERGWLLWQWVFTLATTTLFTWAILWSTPSAMTQGRSIRHTAPGGLCLPVTAPRTWKDSFDGV